MARILRLAALTFALSGAPFIAQATGQVPAPAPDDSQPFALETQDDSALLVLTTPRLPGERLRFVTCEAVLDGNNDFGVNLVKPGRDAWVRAGAADEASVSYTWTFEPGVELAFSARSAVDGIALEYAVTNHTKKTLERVLVHPCLQTMGAPSFHPGTAAQAADDSAGRAARTGIRDYSELYRRLHLWEGSKPFAFAESGLAPREVHLAFLARGEKSLAWGWWQNDTRPFERPWIALRSKDGRKTLGLTFERAAWASSNVGDGRACFHLFGSLGRLAPGERGKLHGRIYLLDGDLAAFAERAARDPWPKK